jgi:hypothetical protein
MTEGSEENQIRKLFYEYRKTWAVPHGLGAVTIERDVLDVVRQHRTEHTKQLQEIHDIVAKMYDMAFGKDWHPRQERDQEIADGLTRLWELLKP